MEGISFTDYLWHRLLPLKSWYSFIDLACVVGKRADDRICPSHVTRVGFLYSHSLALLKCNIGKVTFASYILQVDLSSCNNRELDHLIIYVVLLLCLVTIWTVRGAPRMYFNRGTRVWFIGDCWSEIVSVFVCVTGTICQQNMAMPQEGMHAGSGKKIFIIRVRSYRACIATWYCMRISSAQCSWSLAYWNTARGNRQKHVAGSSLQPVDQMFAASSVPCKRLTSDDMF